MLCFIYSVTKAGATGSTSSPTLSMDRETMAAMRNYSVLKKTRVSNDYYPYCSFFGVYSWGNQHPPCSDIVKPFRQHQLQLSTEVCMYCGKHFKSLVDYFQHQDSVHYSIQALICSLCRSVFLSEAMLGFHITNSHGGPRSFKDALGLEYTCIKKQ